LCAIALQATSAKAALAAAAGRAGAKEKTRYKALAFHPIGSGLRAKGRFCPQAGIYLYKYFILFAAFATLRELMPFPGL
jgi:hypothetical protein